ncbi:MAG: helix-turn-helix transcriptional regulator [Geobacteraceae bacterium]|nr:helix-turn-helix transcriptional regulator [Geobacteraceae bacterium]
MFKPQVKKIKILMIENDINGAQIARMAHVGRSAVHHVITGKSKSPRIRKVIADALHAKVSELWEDDMPKPRKRQQLSKSI